MVALSDSRVTRGSSVFTTSPGLTAISMIGTSLKSPISGTFTSITDIVATPERVVRLGARRARLFGVDAELGHGLGDPGRGQLVLVGKRLERRHRDEVAIDLEVMPEFLAVIRASEASGAEHTIGARDEGPNLIGKQLHVVSGGYHRSVAA